MLKTAPETPKNTQAHLLRHLLRNKSGVTIGALAEQLAISRNAVRQHLTALENDGVVAHGDTLPSGGGRPEHLYVLAEKGQERFPRQYSWLAELLLESWQEQAGAGDLESKLEAMGTKVGADLRAQLPGAAGSMQQITALASGMTNLGYDAAVRVENSETVIEAYNCVFHKLAEKNPAICRFDLALLTESSGCIVEQRSCMVRGGNCCQFRFRPKKAASTGE